MALGAALLLSTVGAAAQSLGDVARANRKGKPQQTASKHFDNDNLPKEEHLSVVGPPPAPDAAANTPSADAASTQAQTTDASGSSTASASSTPASADDPKAKEAERQRVNEEWQKKIEAQKKKIDTLSEDLDLTQREYRLKAVAMYSDAGNRLRNAAQWDKEDTDYKKQIEAKQKALDSAKQDLEDILEQARKAGVPAKMRE